MRNGLLWCKSCGANYDARTPTFRCECGEPLDLLWDGGGEAAEGRTNRAFFFPFEEREWVSLGEGNTPLVSVRNFAEELGLADVQIKNESANPTWSFKDRGTAACVAHARALGFSRIGTVSTGNMAASVAAYGAAAGMEAVILVKGDTDEEKMAPVAIYGPTLLRVEGAYDKLYRESLRLGEELGVYFMNSDVPFRVAGSRTIAFEIAEQRGFSVPDWVVVPASAGGNLRGIINGFEDLLSAGLTDRMPRFLCAQAQGCSPIVAAFDAGEERIKPFESPHTIAHAIENPFPPSGNRVLAELRKYDGIAMGAKEKEIVKAQKHMAHQGFFGQPASCVPLACLRNAREEGVVSEGATAVLVMTGSGLKYTAAFQAHKLKWKDCKLKELAEKVR